MHRLQEPAASSTVTHSHLTLSDHRPGMTRGTPPLTCGNSDRGQGHRTHPDQNRFVRTISTTESDGNPMGGRPKPALSVVREGNPGHAKVKDSLALPPGDLPQPDWTATFTDSDNAIASRCREVASREWLVVVPVLKLSTGVSDVDAQVLHDYCVCVARIDQCERALSRDGLVLEGERGWQKNGHTTIVGQYRQQLRSYIAELGLSPSARVKFPSNPGNDDDDGAFD
jgi:P27 family predicted phage terminase small subunit